MAAVVATARPLAQVIAVLGSPGSMARVGMAVIVA